MRGILYGILYRELTTHILSISQHWNTELSRVYVSELVEKKFRSVLLRA